MTTATLTQDDHSLLQDIEEFYFGDLPWFHGASLVQTEPPLLKVTLTDPESDDDSNEETKTYELSAAQVHGAFTKAQEYGYDLCCAEEIVSEQLGYGCAQDLDVILQTACYGELVFA